MAKLSMICFMMCLSVIGFLLVGCNAELAADCQADIPSLIAKCKQFLQIFGPLVRPSQACCNVVQHTDIPCACTYITPDIQKVVSMKKVVAVAAECGRPLAHGSKCGSYVVPDARILA